MNILLNLKSKIAKLLLNLEIDLITKLADKPENDSSIEGQMNWEWRHTSYEPQIELRREFERNQQHKLN